MPHNVTDHAFIIRPPADLLERRPALRHTSNALARKYAAHELVTEEMLRDIGLSLWRALDVADDFEAARRRAGIAILPLVVESDSAAIQYLPWETLYHPEHGFLGKVPGFTLTRCIAPSSAGEARLESGPLRVLLFTSLPDDVDAERARLNVEEEQAQVQEALARWTAEGLVHLEMPDDGRFATLKQLLGEFEPHLVFLSGHGRFHHQPHTGEAPYGTFLFEDDAGRGVPVRDAEIAQAFVGSCVQAVVLSACESGKSISTALSDGLSRQLSLRGVPHVIGMRESILDQAGIQFARAFCDAIARQERVDVALQQAREAISTPFKDIDRRYTDGAALVELSLGQWCLPALLASDVCRPLIDWRFEAQPPAQQLAHQTLRAVSLPPRFIGRRSELRYLKSRLFGGKQRQLLITGPGGQGKTALAGKLALDLQRWGYVIFDWSARGDGDWDAFIFALQFHLSQSEHLVKTYDRMLPLCKDEVTHARLLLGLLLQQANGRMVLFFDNLESFQRPDALNLDEPRLQAWIQAAQSLEAQGLILLLTSRWQIPGWPDSDHWSLAHASYGDFLQMAQHLRLPADFFRRRERLRQVYDALHGNGRGLTFFAAAIRGMDLEEETVFLAELAQTSADIQVDMALEAIIGQLDRDALALLQRLPVYAVPVPREGVIKLGSDLPQPDALLARLLAVSLVEPQINHAWQVIEYQCSPLVAAWLQAQGLGPDTPALYRAAAGYLHYLYENERRTLFQAIVVHQAWRSAGEKDRADRFALDTIVGRFSLQGLFRTLLDKWLPDICNSPDPQTRAEALGQTGKQHVHVGNYATALRYLEQSLAISQEIGDIAGLCATLFNMGHMHWQNEEVPQAVQAWVTVYRLARPRHLAQALDALERLAGQLGLDGGLDGWEQLAQRMEQNT